MAVANLFQMSISTPSLFLSSPFFISSPQNPSFIPTLRNPNCIKSSMATINGRNLSIRAEGKAIPLLSFEGSRIGEVYLDLKTARPRTARAVVHRGIVTELRNKRQGTKKTKSRAEVRGGGRKPYPQKGTGRARCGSIRSPLHRGGGHAHAIRPKDWSIKMNRKEKKLAISTAFQSAAVDSIAVEDFQDKFVKPRTKDFLEAMGRWGLDPYKRVMFFLDRVSNNVMLSSRNIGTLSMMSPQRLYLFNILGASKLVFTPASVDYLNSMYGARKGGVTWDEDDAYEVDYVDEDEDGEYGDGDEDEANNVDVDGGVDDDGGDDVDGDDEVDGDLRMKMTNEGEK